jgi:hypothetical protein
MLAPSDQRGVAAVVSTNMRSARLSQADGNPHRPSLSAALAINRRGALPPSDGGVAGHTRVISASKSAD